MYIKEIFIISSSLCLLFLLQHYLYIRKPCMVNQDDTIRNIIDIFQQYTLTYDIDKKSIDNDEKILPQPRTFDEYKELSRKLNYFIQQQKPIILTMVGFPYKSSNTQDKVICSSADAAEYYSLMYLQDFLNKIKALYKPGIQLCIFTDGIVFCDIERISDNIVLEYEDRLKIIVQDFPDIEICTMRDLCPKQSPIGIRQAISSMYPDLQQFNTILEADQKLREDTTTLTQRLAFELAILSLSEKEIVTIGLQEMHRSMQYSTFLKKFRPEETISCSVHYQKDLTKKIGLKLSESCVTPWHGVLVDTHGVSSIEHAKDVDTSEYQQAEWKINGISLLYLKNK